MYNVLFVQTEIKGRSIYKKEVKSHYIFEKFTEAILFSKRNALRLYDAYMPEFEIDDFIKECKECMESLTNGQVKSIAQNCTDETFGKFIYSYKTSECCDLYGKPSIHYNPSAFVEGERLHHAFIYSFEIYEQT